MSDYKIVNGKKVRACKYGCDSELVWSEKAGILWKMMAHFIQKKDVKK